MQNLITSLLLCILPTIRNDRFQQLRTIQYDRMRKIKLCQTMRTTMLDSIGPVQKSINQKQLKFNYRRFMLAVIMPISKRNYCHYSIHSLRNNKITLHCCKRFICVGFAFVYLY